MRAGILITHAIPFPGTRPPAHPPPRRSVIQPPLRYQALVRPVARGRICRRNMQGWRKHESRAFLSYLREYFVTDRGNASLSHAQDVVRNHRVFPLVKLEEVSRPGTDFFFRKNNYTKDKYRVRFLILALN